VTESRIANGSAAAPDRIVRHAAVDRAFHWLAAACVLVLMGTAFLPILGIEFGWVTVHWATGLVLIVAVVLHVARSFVGRRLRRMGLGASDFRDGLAIMRATLGRRTVELRKPGKYSVAQKLIHHAFAGVVLTAAATGALMLARIDTPWWRRDPYLLPDSTWGVVYVLHGLAALVLITMVMTHIYFALRPEKRLFLRSMIKGWITSAEYAEQHDPDRWRVKQ
jgi:formate dehydrogenase subunit gamma